MARAAQIAEHAVELARDSADTEATADALLALHDVRWRPGHAEQRLEVLGRLAEVIRARAGCPMSPGCFELRPC